MAHAKVAVSIDAGLLREVDKRVAAGEFASRSQAVATALIQLLGRDHARQHLLGELAKLDAAEERSLADEDFAAEATWPKYWKARSIGLSSARSGGARKADADLSWSSATTSSMPDRGP